MRNWRDGSGESIGTPVWASPLAEHNKIDWLLGDDNYQKATARGSGDVYVV
ncbi:MAG: hypothetical protein GF353_04510 [Candidatus Lokiarchaeota archaeon]|nr:hypothetical protein [Candidatus Lokiarchaeota archaeon]